MKHLDVVIGTKECCYKKTNEFVEVFVKDFDKLVTNEVLRNEEFILIKKS